MYGIYELAAEMACEDLPKEVCAFSIASSGKRCLLETEKAADGGVEYQCRTSEVVVERMADYIETDQCVEACGVDRNSVELCEKQKTNPRRAMVELVSSGAAPGPVYGVSSAPSPSPL
ncbi:hypothetical protein V8G54_010591 [Vigna mungo]|uniref:PAR1 protein n=1 Tax=Vigna mungo TaxID=3915 RepID=A0AAQ3NWY4_VIGMU